MAAGFEAVVVLGVGFMGVVVGIEAAEAVKVGSAAFAEGLNEGEAETEPGFVGGRDVSAGELDAARDFLDLFFQGGCPAAVGRGCLQRVPGFGRIGVAVGLRQVVLPFGGVEFTVHRSGRHWGPRGGSRLGRCLCLTGPRGRGRF